MYKECGPGLRVAIILNISFESTMYDFASLSIFYLLPILPRPVYLAFFYPTITPYTPRVN